MSEHDRVFAKCAWRLIPFMMLLYLVNFIDRLNVGFAALTMNKDLGFSPSVFGFGAGIFFAGYVPFQVPANVVLARFGARRWIFCILAIWGMVSASTAFVQGPASFSVLRFLLGAAEAGFFPGMVFYLTLWFPQTYRGRFTAIFMVAIPLAGFIGAPLSSLILGMDGVLGIHGWQWLFLLEGLPAFVLAFVVSKLMPDSPATAQWLSAAEKDIVISTLAREASMEQRKLWPALRDPRVLALGLAGLGFSAGLYGTTVWLPQIVQAMGFSNLAVGFIVALPYVASMAAMVWWGRSSDARSERIWHVALPWLLAALGFAAASIAQNDVLVLVALTTAMVGILAAVGPFFSLPSSFLRGTAAAAGIALVNAIATVGGFVGPYVIGLMRETAGGYESSMVALAVGMALSGLIVLAVGRAMAPRLANIERTT